MIENLTFSENVSQNICMKMKVNHIDLYVAVFRLVTRLFLLKLVCTSVLKLGWHIVE